MRVLFTVSGSPAHYLPMVPLGWALQAAGHEVRVACPPGQAGTVGTTGLTGVPILADLDMMYLSRFANLAAAVQGAWPYDWAPLHPDTGEPVELSTVDFGALAGRVKRHIAAESRRGYDEAVAYARGWRPDLVLHDRLSPEGVLAARVTGVPSLAHLWGVLGTVEDDPSLYPVPVDYTGSFARYGVPPLTAELIGDAIDPSPDSMAVGIAGRRRPVRYLAYNGPGAVPELPAPQRPRVCVVWSNSISGMYGRSAYLVPFVLSALAGLDVEVLLLAHPDDAAALGPLPDRVRPLHGVPLHTVLDSCAAVVHHGGAGSGMTALAAGVPQVMLTLGPEWTVIGRRLAGTGVGVQLPAHLAEVDAVRAAVSDVLDKPAYAQAARRMAAEVRQAPSPAALVPALETLRN